MVRSKELGVRSATRTLATLLVATLLGALAATAGAAEKASHFDSSGAMVASTAQDHLLSKAVFIAHYVRSADSK